MTLATALTDGVAAGLAALGAGPAQRIEALPGGASNRGYVRVVAGDRRWVVMVLPEEALLSEEATAGPVPDELPFVALQALLFARHVPVPALHRYDRERGLLWLDDLGDETLLDRLGGVGTDARVGWYRLAVDLLVRLQGALGAGPGAAICYQRRFERRLLRWELDHYLEWRVGAQLGRRPSAATAAALAAEMDALVDRLLALPQVVCHRDFQSTNLMFRGGEMVVIDFQDALLGPYCYDLVALLRDSYVALSREELTSLIDHYLQQRPDLDGPRFREAFALQTIQRKLKDAGRFVFIDRKKGDPRFLRFIGPSLGYVRDALGVAPRLGALLAEVDPEAFA